MDFVTREELRRLVHHQAGTCISIYLPTHRSGADTLQDPIRLKNLLRYSEHSLQKLQCAADDIDTMLAPARKLRENYDFWQYQSDGLALFMAKDLFRLYRLQLAVPELQVVAGSFHVKPLLAAVTGNSHYWVLALSQKRARLFRGTPASLVELEVAGVPGTVSEMQEEDPAGRQLPAHVTASGKEHGRTSVLHLPTERDHKNATTTYFHRLDQALHPLFESNPGPLILACMDQHCASFRKVNSNADLVDEWISGNADDISAHELHQRSLPIAAAQFRKAQKEAADQYIALWHTQRASNKLSDILPAALQGRVASLLVAVGVQQWGHLDATTHEAVMAQERSGEDEDLLNLAAIHTYIARGMVYPVSPDQVPGGGLLAAVFRY